jgi:hypothetical protein
MSVGRSILANTDTGIPKWETQWFAMGTRGR